MVDMNGGALLRPPAGGTGMIQVNVRNQYVLDVVRSHPLLAKARLQGGQRAHGPCFHKDISFGSVNEIGGNRTL
jgi:hypothetical protein